VPPAPTDAPSPRPPETPRAPREGTTGTRPADRVLLVPHEASGLRLDRFLAECFPKCSRRRWMDLVKEGLVLVDGRRAKPGAALRGEERVTIPDVDAAVAEASARARLRAGVSGERRERGIEVLHRDEDLLVVVKPPNVPCHGGADLGATRTLLERLKDHVFEGFGLVHRLDRDTSGVMVLVRDPLLRNKMAAAFADEGSVEKVYDALVEGVPEPESGVVDLPLSDPGHGGKGRVDHREGKPARTEYAVIERLDGAARVRAIPRTGRTHQIRLHLAALGTPLLVDPLYGRRSGWRLVDPKGGPAARLARTPLHAASLTFPHPRTGERMTFHAPLLPDHRRALEVLRVVTARRRAGESPAAATDLAPTADETAAHDPAVGDAGDATQT